MKKICNYLWQSTRTRHLLFLLATVLSITLMGYYFGTFDQASHIPFLKKYVDPSLYPTDRFFDLRSSHYSFFWLFLIPFYRQHILEITMFLLHILATYLTFWAVWQLSKTLFNNPIASFFSTVCFIIPHIGFGGFPFIEFSLLNRTFVLPFLLIAVNYYLKKQYWWSFLILGIMYNLHAVSVNFVLFMLLFDAIVQIKQKGWRPIIVGLILFLTAASPVLLWKFGHSPIDLTIRKEWYLLISQSMLAHLFNFFSLNPYVLIITLGGISSLILFYIANRYSPLTKYNKTLENFIWALIIILFVQFISSLWFPATIIIQSQIMRAGTFIIIIVYLYFSYYIAELYLKKQLSNINSILLTIAYLFSLSPLILLAAWGIERLIKSKKILKIILIIVIFVFTTTIVVMYRLKIWSPGINIFARHSANYDIQIWAKNNTPKNAIFIVPPYLWGFYNLEWRVISERSPVVTLSELLEAAFEPSYVQYWRPRLEDVAPGAINKFNGNFFESIETTKRAYNSLTLADIKRISYKYNASLIVVEKPNQYDLPKEYENREFSVYKIIQ